MYRVSPEGLRWMDYCNMVKGFINCTISNPKNINGGSILCSCKRFKNKKSQDSDIVTMHLLLKNNSWKNTYIGLHSENPLFFMRP
jgi:hypothetical protein